MKKDEVVKNDEIMGFGKDLRKRMEGPREVFASAVLKKERVLKGIEDYQDEMISISQEIGILQDQLNSELTTSGKANPKTLDRLAVLRHRYEDLENVIASLKQDSMAVLDEEIRIATLEMNKALELAVDELRPVFVTLINSQFAKIDQIVLEWYEGMQGVLREYGNGLDGIDRQKLMKLSNIKLQSDLLSRIS